jgi:PilZ domain
VNHEVSPWASHHQLVVDVEVSDLRAGVQFVARTKTLSRFGCGINTSFPVAKGANVKIKLYHQGVEIKALARVVYSGPESGMGIVFTNIDRGNERILELWIDELAN